MSNQTQPQSKVANLNKIVSLDVGGIRMKVGSLTLLAKAPLSKLAKEITQFLDGKSGSTSTSSDLIG